jgi:hypothetical protein
MMLSALFVAFTLTGFIHGNVLDPKYRTECLIVHPTGGQTPQQHTCDVALFTYRDVSFHGPAVYLDDGLCASSLVKFDSLKGALGELDTAVVVKRGECSFTVKAQNAQALGFKLLLIANSDAEGFPIGPAQVDFPLHIPVLMAGKGIWDNAVPYHPESAAQVSEVDGTQHALVENSVYLQSGLTRLDIEFGE